ncbi:hypothetical protein PI125_g24337 [Phytophthora idaei]|nr:hypothetical protein PI125_g24337 [Phytophthora idaei]KAG3171793.1 hypothetical protein PI126_g1696 [Phytophthora idaei]
MKTTRGRAMGQIAEKTTKQVVTVGRSVDFEGSEDDDSEAVDNDLGYYGGWSEEVAESKSSVKAVRVSGALCAAWPSLRDDLLAMDEVLARCLAWMETNDWIGLFNTRLGWQTTRGELWAELNHPTKAASIAQFAEETVSLLLAMGLDILSYPSEFCLRKWSAAEAGAELRECKMKLRVIFGMKLIVNGRQSVTRATVQTKGPSTLLLPELPAKVQDSERVFADSVFSEGENSTYFQDSHMVSTYSVHRSRRLLAEIDGSYADRGGQRSGRGTCGRRLSNHRSGYSSGSDDSFGSDGLLDDDDDIWDKIDDDPRDELDRPMKALGNVDNMFVSSTYVAFTPVEPFVGRYNRSEDSLRWFKTFVYEMEGTHTLPNEWCLPFELSLHDGAMYWFLQLPRKTRRNWKLLSHEFLRYYCTPYTQPLVVCYYSATRGRKEHICDYLNRLSGYALSAHLLIGEGERDAKLRVDQFLLTCGDNSMMRYLGWLGLSDIW